MVKVFTENVFANHIIFSNTTVIVCGFSTNEVMSCCDTLTCYTLRPPAVILVVKSSLEKMKKTTNVLNDIQGKTDMYCTIHTHLLAIEDDIMLSF